MSTYEDGLGLGAFRLRHLTIYNIVCGDGDKRAFASN